MTSESTKQNESGSVIDDIVLSNQAKSFCRRLKRWYIGNHRNFVWRKTKDPYLILLSEVLLQRTQALQVESNFNNIVSQIPTLRALYDSKYDDVAKILQP